ncbi:MAG: hypothetical protein N2544_14055, partial [Burkholderiales bacterium]|nr:hypothetical protein [Burkholderiales bacterium]
HRRELREPTGHGVLLWGVAGLPSAGADRGVRFAGRAAAARERGRRRTATDPRQWPRATQYSFALFNTMSSKILQFCRRARAAARPRLGARACCGAPGGAQGRA